ncbi:MAG: ROK family transcriptional regulator [Rhizobiaceae bacterium]|nr:ROK family transcriptional regulator [Rhizobiaceae bacterium]
MNAPASIASSPRRIRQTNEVAALWALYQDGRLSRADLARRLRLNRSSSGHIVAGLTEDGLVREVVDNPAVAPGQVRAGRPGIMLELVPEAVTFLGVEIGVEHISAVEIDLKARIVSSVTEPFDGRAADVSTAVARAIGLAFDHLSEDRRTRCEGFGISTPSHMDRNGSVRLAPLLGWRDVPLADLVRSRLPSQIPVMAENDANALAFGATYGIGAAHAGVTLFLVMETGVGGGIVIDGRLFRGASGLAGEIGHLHLPTESGPSRTLEQLVGLEPLMAAYAAVSAGREARLDLFLADVQDRVPAAVSIAEDWARCLAYALAQTCRIIDADRVVLGGSVSALYPLVAARVTAHIQMIQEPGFPVPAISLHDNTSFGSAFGAACMLHQRYLSLESHRFSDDAATSAG